MIFCVLEVLPIEKSKLKKKKKKSRSRGGMTEMGLRLHQLRDLLLLTSIIFIVIEILVVVIF